MTHYHHSSPDRLRRLKYATVLLLLLTACSASPIGTPLPSANVASTAIPATSIPNTAAPAVPTSTKPVSTPALVSPTIAPTDAAIVPPLPDCSSSLTLTPAQTEGPYYTPNTPERTSLIEPGMTGTRLILTGYVLDVNCRPIANAWLDFWQADDAGEYDNAGYVMRGHQFTDANGRYQLETVFPGLYPGRTRHIHVKVQAPNGPILTSQIYFPGEPANASDNIFDPALIADVQMTADGLRGTFNFVVNVK